MYRVWKFMNLGKQKGKWQQVEVDVHHILYIDLFFRFEQINVAREI